MLKRRIRRQLTEGKGKRVAPSITIPSGADLTAILGELEEVFEHLEPPGITLEESLRKMAERLVFVSVNDYLWGKESDGNWIDSRNWFFISENDSRMSFNYCCKLLGIDGDMFRFTLNGKRDQGVRCLWPMQHQKLLEMCKKEG